MLSELVVLLVSLMCMQVGLLEGRIDRECGCAHLDPVGLLLCLVCQEGVVDVAGQLFGVWVAYVRSCLCDEVSGHSLVGLLHADRLCHFIRAWSLPPQPLIRQERRRCGPGQPLRLGLVLIPGLLIIIYSLLIPPEGESFDLVSVLIQHHLLFSMLLCLDFS